MVRLILLLIIIKVTSKYNGQVWTWHDVRAEKSLKICIFNTLQEVQSNVSIPLVRSGRFY